MSLLDLAKSAVGSMLGGKLGGQLGGQLGAQLGGNGANAMGVVMQLIEQSGGVNQLLEKFNSAGMGDAVQSWVGTGKNMPINPEQIISALGSTQVSQLAKTANINTADLGKMLAQFLPLIIDKLSPSGQVQGQNVSMNQLLEIGKTFLK